MIDKYNFKIGEKVIDTYGRSGTISYVCHCECCEERGFYEFVVKWDYDPDTQNWITCYQEQKGFPRIHQIGERIFTPFDLQGALAEQKDIEEQMNKLQQQQQSLIQGIQLIKA